VILRKVGLAEKLSCLATLGESHIEFRKLFVEYVAYMARSLVDFEIGQYG
jgi:hypothetical protein